MTELTEAALQSKRQMTLAYGPLEHQVGDLFVPEQSARATICLIHGSFWRFPYNRLELTPVAQFLSDQGFAVWNIDYRSVGSGGGWPTTLHDVAAAIDHLPVAAAGTPGLPLDKVVVAGHSAGGHLALWSTHRGQFAGCGPPQVNIRAVVGLAPVADLVEAHSLSVGRNSVAEFLGGSPETVGERYQSCSPRLLLPLGVRQLILHGENDTALPASLSANYADAARTAGDRVDFHILSGAGHMDFLNPQSAAIGCFRDWLEAL